MPRLYGGLVQSDLLLSEVGGEWNTGVAFEVYLVYADFAVELYVFIDAGVCLEVELLVVNLNTEPKWVVEFALDRTPV